MALITNSQHKIGKQLSLFDEETEIAVENPLKQVKNVLGKDSVKNGSAFSDPAFASNKVLPVHRWVPWIAGFSSDFVKRALGSYLDTKGVVLDPFAGVGTTLVEAIAAGHDTVGFEINPYPSLACHTKLNAHLLDVEVLKSEISRFETFFFDKLLSGYMPASVSPEGFKTRADFYSPHVLHKVLIVQDFIESLKNTDVQNIFKLAFAATMVRYSNYSYEPSLARRVSSGKSEIIDFPVMETIRSKLVEMGEDIIWLQSRLPAEPLKSSVINDTFFNYKEHLEPQSIDLIITSPPYLNNYHYNRNTRPQLYWLKYAEKPQDLRSLENANFGKYWQTVRDHEYLGLDFPSPDADIEECLKILRSLGPEKKVYGGNGWANYAATYFNDCYKFAQGIYYCLKVGGTALVVIGNSVLQGLTIPTDQYFAKIAKTVGLEVVEIHIPRASRVGSSIIQSSVRAAKAKDSHQLYEAVVELRKI